MKGVAAVWVVLPIGALCLAGVVWLVSAIPAAGPGESAPVAVVEREQEVAVREGPVAAVAVAAPAPLAAPLVPAVLEAPRVDDDEAAFLRVRENVRAQLTAQYAKRHEEIVRRCWPGDAPEGQRARLTLSLQVDAEGRELVRSVQESREAWVEGFGQCFTDAARGAFEFDPPGRPVSVDVVLDFP